MTISHEEEFGDTIGIAQEQVLRIGHININGLPESKDDAKNELFCLAMAEHDMHIVGVTETNKCWHLLEEEDRWKSRSKGWWESSSTVIAYNIKDNELSSPFQPGGTMVHSINKSAHRVIEKGRDTTGLGRWSWIRYRGKHDVILQVISAYRPCVPRDPGESTVHSQHQRYLDNNDDNRRPRQAMLEDLGQHITSSREQGDQVALLMDCNEDVRSTHFTDWLAAHQLIDCVLSKHGQEDAPPTYNRGSLPIDGIFLSSTLQVLKCGYLPFGSFPSDHRAVWADITYESAFGASISRCIQPSARKLKCSDPRIVRKWTQAYEQFIRRNNLLRQQFLLEGQSTNVFTPEMQEEFEQIMAMRDKGIQYADKHCRSRKMGHVPFSPAYKDHTNTISLWDAVVKKKSGVKYSMGKLRRLESKAGIMNSLHCSLGEVKEKHKQALAAYQQFKLAAKEARKTFLSDLAEAIAHENEQSSDNVYRQLIHREDQREASRKMRYALGKTKKSGIKMVETVNPDGDIIPLDSKEDIEKACLLENEEKY